MSSPHHHHHHHHHDRSSQCCSCCCCCSPPSPSPSDQLLQLLAGHLLLQTPSHHPEPKPRYPHMDQLRDHQQPTPKLLHSLIRRVAALESRPPPRPSTPPPSPPLPPPPPPVSLRDLAARTIQSRFRRFLVARSRAFRQLKQLATLKSHVAALKSSLSGKTHLRPEAISGRAMDLLLELDSIKSGDLMIREGKKSISRELERTLEFVEKVLVKEQQVSLGAAEINRNRRMVVKQAKRVSFGNNGDAGGDDPFAEEEDDGDRWGSALRFNRELRGIGGFSRVSDEDGDSTHLGREGWKLSDDGDEESPRGAEEDGVSCGASGNFQGQDGNLGLSAPLPVQMEPRRDQSKKKVLTAKP